MRIPKSILVSFVCSLNSKNILFCLCSLKNKDIPFLRLFSEEKRHLFCVCSLKNKDITFFCICSLNSWDVFPGWPWPNKTSMALSYIISFTIKFYHLLSFLYCLFICTLLYIACSYVHILSVGIHILINTSRIYIMYLLNIPLCVNELVFPSIYSVLVYHWNIEPWWVGT